MTIEENIGRLEKFKTKLQDHQKTHDPKIRAWLNQNSSWVKQEVLKAGCFITITAAPPPAVGGLILRDIDPFGMMFEEVYLRSMVPYICDMIDKTIGVLRSPPSRLDESDAQAKLSASVQKGYAFVAMPIDPDDHQLVDVLEAIKAAALDCGVVAERVDEVESNERITDRILESIRKAEFVIADLTKERPNVFYEAGYAHGIGKIPIYIARKDTRIHFDVQDYPVIEFRNMKELKDGIKKRLLALSSGQR